jgi:hypothetical protein
MEHSVTRLPDRFGFWISTLTAVTTAITFIMAVLTPPKAGPFSAYDCLAYPYTDFAAHIPRDFFWMYPALVVAPLVVILLATMHERTPPAWRPFARSALAFGVMAATTLTAAYFIQLRFVQPALLKGELEGLAPLTQYNPHGVFIALEEAGYTLMAVALLFAGLAQSKDGRMERALKWILVGGFVAVAVLFVVLSVVYGMDLEYRFEVAAITVDWTVLIVASTLLAILYARSGQPPPA